MTQNPFEVGDIVHLKTGEAPQQVTYVSSSGKTICTQYLHTHHQWQHRQWQDFTHHQHKEPQSMSNSINNGLISLLQMKQGATTVKVVPQGKRTYGHIFKVPPALANSLKVNDLVVVNTDNNKFAVGKVVETHDTPQIDLDAADPYNWVVQHLDTSTFEALVQEEKDMHNKLVNAEAMSRLKALTDAIGLDPDALTSPMLQKLGAPNA